MRDAVPCGFFRTMEPPPACAPRRYACADLLGLHAPCALGLRPGPARVAPPGCQRDGDHPALCPARRRLSPLRRAHRVGALGGPGPSRVRRHSRRLTRWSQAEAQVGKDTWAAGGSGGPPGAPASNPVLTSGLSPIMRPMGAADHRRMRRGSRRSDRASPEARETQKAPPFDRSDLAAAATIGCGALGLFLATLCPTIYVEDSAEFSTAAAVFGLPHPRG